MGKHRTTLVFDDRLWRAMKRTAADHGATLSEWLAHLIQDSLAKSEAPKKPWTLNWHRVDLGGATVNLTTREQMYEFISRRF